MQPFEFVNVCLRGIFVVSLSLYRVTKAFLEDNDSSSKRKMIEEMENAATALGNVTAAKEAKEENTA